MSTVLVTPSPTATTVAPPRRDRLRVAVAVPTEAATVCTVEGEVDLYTAGELRSRLIGALRTAPPLLVVDLSTVTFFGVAGLRVLIEARTWAGHNGVDLRLITGPRCVERLFEVSGYAGAFEIVSGFSAIVPLIHPCLSHTG
ncbi:STAS domain-containing protein [Nocardia sp. NPDC052566]|uniref:STAS domain-containing protein n=1 Tax=Nocardia sp. NPDC052566 TaxID=3364330 RepID=UPI0037CA6DE3